MGYYPRRIEHLIQTVLFNIIAVCTKLAEDGKSTVNFNVERVHTLCNDFEKLKTSHKAPIEYMVCTQNNKKGLRGWKWFGGMTLTTPSVTQTLQKSCPNCILVCLHETSQRDDYH